MSRTLSAVLFDLDDTLHDDDLVFTQAARHVATTVAQEYGVEIRALEAAYIAHAHGFWSGLRSEHLSEPIRASRERLWGAALADVGLGDVAGLAQRCAALYNENRKGRFVPFPDSLPLLARLRAQGKKLGLVTNGFSETHREKIALLQFDEAFDGIFIADEVGMLKPDPRLFEHACKTLGALPEQTAMVGDRYERDITGARDAGLYTVWFNIRAEQLPPGAMPPDVECANLAEVGAALEAASR